MAVVEVFADVGCPFAHVGISMVVAERARRDRPDVDLWIRSWPLEMVNGEGFAPDVVVAKAEALRSQLHVDRFDRFDGSAYAATFIPAMELSAVAYEAGPRVGEALALELRSLTFEEGVDVSDPAVLAGLARRFEVDIPDPDRRSRVEADLAEGRSRGVIGSPHFFAAQSDSFCPSLDISSTDAGIEVSVARDGLDELLEMCFG